MNAAATHYLARPPVCRYFTIYIGNLRERLRPARPGRVIVNRYRRTPARHASALI